MTDELFHQHVKGLITIKKQKFRELVKETVFYWTEISQGYSHFSKNQSMIQSLKSIKQSELIEFAKNLLNNAPNFIARGNPFPNPFY